MTYNRQFIPINIGVLTVSDTRTMDNDSSGDLLEKRIKRSGHFLGARSIVPDEKKQISSKPKALKSQRENSVSR